VKVSVNAGGAAGEALGEALGGEALGGGDTEGVAVCRSPTDGEALDPQAASPSEQIAITDTAGAANLEYVFMAGNLLGTRVSARPAGV
jgi:hypothetical protein